MKSWEIKFTPEGEHDLRVLDRPIRKRIIDKLQWLSSNLSNIAPESLSNIWKDYFKLRVGDWRVIYQIEPKSGTLIVHRIELRDKVYKRS